MAIVTHCDRSDFHLNEMFDLLYNSHIVESQRSLSPFLILTYIFRKNWKVSL